MKKFVGIAFIFLSENNGDEDWRGKRMMVDDEEEKVNVNATWRQSTAII